MIKSVKSGKVTHRTECKPDIFVIPDVILSFQGHTISNVLKRVAHTVSVLSVLVYSLKATGLS